MNKRQSDNQHQADDQPSKADQHDSKPSTDQLQQFDQLRSRAYRVISNVVSGLTESKLSPVSQDSIDRKVNQLYKQIRSMKRGQLKDLRNVMVHLIRIKATECLTNKKDLVDQAMRHAALSDRQSKSWSAEMKSLDQRIIKQLSHQKDEISIQETIADGLSSFNGFYYKWLNMSRIYLLNRLEKAVKQTKHQVSKLSLSLTSRHLAAQKIGLIDSKVQKGVIDNTGFIGMHKMQKSGINELHQISIDHGHVLHKITSFDKFVDQTRSSVVKFKGLSRSVRLRLIHEINSYQNTILDKFKHPFTAVADYILDAERPKLLQKLLSSAAKEYYQELIRQAPDFNYSHEYKSLANFKKISHQIQQQLIGGQLGSLNHDLFVKVLKKLNQAAVHAKVLLYQDRIDQAINELSLRISSHADLSSADQQRLYNLTVIYSRYIKRQPFTFRLSFIKRRLTAFFDRQYLYVLRRVALVQMTLLQERIQNSHLKPKWQKYFQAEILKIWKTSQAINIKRAGFSQIEAQSLMIDRRQDLSQLRNLCQMVQKRISTVKDSPVLHSQVSSMIKKITAAKSISRADHVEQQGENWFYHDLLYKYSKASQSRKQIVFDQRRKFHDEINLAVLQPDLKQIMNDAADHYVNIYGDKMLQKQGIAQSKARWSMQLSHSIKPNLVSLFSRIKQEYLAKANNLIRDAYYQLMAYSSSQTVLKRFAEIRLQSLKKIRQAKHLMRLEFNWQSGLQDMYKFTGKIMSKFDSVRLRFNQQLYKMLNNARHQLNINPAKSAKVKSAFVNRMLRAVNQANGQTDSNSDDNLGEVLRAVRQKLGRILRQSYSYDWSKKVSRAELLMNNNLALVSDKVKRSSLDSLKDTKLNVNRQINQASADKLSRVLSSGQRKLHQVVQHGVYLNPVKHSLYQKLNSVITKTRNYINKFTESKMRTKYLKRLATIKSNVNHRVSVINDDHKLALVSRSGHKKIDSLGLEAVRKSQLNKFGKYSSKVEKAFKKLKLLNDQERRSIGRKFNRSYHKSIYQISHASDVTDYQTCERKGVKALSKILDHGKSLNAKKSPYLHSIVAKINSAKQQIRKLNNLNESDKKASNHLLDEIKQRSIHMIGSAPDKRRLLSTEKSGKKMVSQILNKISSADVLVSAIQSANTKISQSSLGSSQKQRMLKKIRKMIGSELIDNHKGSKGAPVKKINKPDKKDKENNEE